MSEGRDADTVVTQTPSSEAPPSTKRLRAPIPTTLGRYAIRRMVGRGGVGAVYEAHDPELGRNVAIKMLREDRIGDPEELRREAQALARLVHPNVVTVHDVGVTDGEVFLVMQLVSGMTIDKWIVERKPSAEKIVELYRRAGEGLAAAHAAGVIHCDFKPGNILVDDHAHVRVTDFGLAKMTRTQTDPGENTMRTVAGTPAYMAPEQFLGVATPKSDQFAFCVALWEALAGERPFEDVPIDTAVNVDRKPPPRHPRIPARFARVLERGLATESADRYTTMVALLADLRPRRLPWWIAAAAAAAIALGIGIYFLTRPAPTHHVRSEADVEKPVALTSFGTQACAYAPAIEPGGKYVVFDRTEGEAVDLYSMPLDGGVLRRHTSASTWEWRAHPGRRAGEVVHLVHHAKETGSNPKVAYLDLDTNAQTVVLDRLAWDAIVAGNSLFYTPDLPHGIRRLAANNADEALASPPEGHHFNLLTASPRGDLLASLGSSTDAGPVKPCIIDVETRAVRCSATNSTPARPAFGADGRTLYFAVDNEIRAWDLTTNTESVIFRGDYPEGGLAASPDGSALVYSNCFGRSAIVDASTDKPVVDDQNATQPSVAVNGALAWVSISFRSRVLIAQTAAGQRIQVTNVQKESVHTPVFNRDGSAIAYVASEPNPGIFVVYLATPGAIHQLTRDERDSTPIWTDDGRVAFTRGDGSGNYQAYVVSADGGEPQRITTASRSLFGARAHELLVWSATTDRLYWIDMNTGVERAGPPQPRGELQYVSLSPSKTWIVYQLGANGQSLWRARLDNAPEKVHEYAAGQTVGYVAIDDDGRVLTTPNTWSGDIFVMRPRPGHRF